MVLHDAARLDAARLVVIAFRSRSGAMTEQAGGNADVGRIVDRGDWDGVRNYEVKGSNSYSKMVARYRQDLLAVHAASEAAQ
jgi:hypothetical protein